MTPIENGTRMNDGSGIGTILATTTHRERYRHYLAASWATTRETGIRRYTGGDPTMREKDAGICTSMMGNESGTKTRVDG